MYHNKTVTTQYYTIIPFAMKVQQDCIALLKLILNNIYHAWAHFSFTEPHCIKKKAAKIVFYSFKSNKIHVALFCLKL